MKQRLTMYSQRNHEEKKWKKMMKRVAQTLAGQEGKPLTFASTRSPKRKCPFALALFAARRRAGGMTWRTTSWKNSGN